jgi:hypothetical protein
MCDTDPPEPGYRDDRFAMSLAGCVCNLLLQVRQNAGEVGWRGYPGLKG